MSEHEVQFIAADHTSGTDAAARVMIEAALKSNDVDTWRVLYSPAYLDQTDRVLAGMVDQTHRALGERKEKMQAHADELDKGPKLAALRREYAGWRSKTSYFAGLLKARRLEIAQLRTRQHREMRDDRAAIRDVLARLARAVWHHRHDQAAPSSPADHVLWLNLHTLELAHGDDRISLSQWVQDSMDREQANGAAVLP